MLTLAALIEKYLDKILNAALPYKIVMEWEQGVKTRSGRVVALCRHDNGLFGTGIHLYWPLIGSLTAWECNVEAFRTDPQTIGGVTFSFQVQARIRRLDRWFVAVQDPMVDVVSNTIMAAAGEIALTLPEGQAPGADFCDAVKRKAQSRMYGWGCEIMHVSFENVDKVPALRLIGAEQAPIFGGTS